LLSGEIMNRIQQINFQFQLEVPSDNFISEGIGYDEISQYIDYDSDDDHNSEVQYNFMHDFYASFKLNIMHNLIEHPSVLNPFLLMTTDSSAVKPNQCISAHICYACSAEFSFKNKLFRHLRTVQHFQNTLANTSEVFHMNTEVIKSMYAPVLGAGLLFRSYNFTELQVKFTPSAKPVWVCLDLGYGISCIDYKILNEQVPSAPVISLPPAIQIRGLREQVHHMNQYVVLSVFVPDLKNGTQVFDEITKEFYIINNLFCNMLIEINVIELEGI